MVLTPLYFTHVAGYLTRTQNMEKTTETDKEVEFEDSKNNDGPLDEAVPEEGETQKKKKKKRKKKKGNVVSLKTLVLIG